MFLILDHQDCDTTGQAFQSEALADRLAQQMNEEAGFPRFIVLPEAEAQAYADDDTLDEDFDLEQLAQSSDWWTVDRRGI